MNELEDLQTDLVSVSLCLANALRTVAEKMDAEEMLPSLPQVIAASPVTFRTPSPLLDEMSNFLSLLLSS